MTLTSTIQHCYNCGFVANVREDHAQWACANCGRVHVTREDRLTNADGLALLIGAENSLFSTTYGGVEKIDWQTVEILRNAANRVRYAIAQSIGATLNYGMPKDSVS